MLAAQAGRLSLVCHGIVLQFSIILKIIFVVFSPGITLTSWVVILCIWRGKETTGPDRTLVYWFTHQLPAVVESGPDQGWILESSLSLLWEWEEPSYVSYRLLPPEVCVSRNWILEPEPSVKLRHSIIGASLTARPNTCLWVNRLCRKEKAYWALFSLIPVPW